MRDDEAAGEWHARVAALRWAVKESFVGYVQGGGGSITVVEPASVGQAGFEFPIHSSRDELLVFAGGVVFQAHGGALSVAIAEPAIARSTNGWILTIADIRAPESDDARRPIALLDVREVGDDVVVIAPTLTISGSAMFGLAYPEGLELDPIVLSLARP
jgi:hypothetical protein